MAAIRFPHLNLWRNPFGELTQEERIRLSVCDLRADLQWLGEGGAVGNRIVQYIGPCGFGKSTRLLALRNAVGQDPDLVGSRSSRYLYVPPERTTPAWKGDDLLFIDEADRTRWLARLQMFRSRRVVAIAVHRCLKSQLQWLGIDVRTVSISNDGDATRLQAIFNCRVKASLADDSKPVPEISLEQARYLIGRFGDDIRGAESYLYDRFQVLKSVDEPIC